MRWEQYVVIIAGTIFLFLLLQVILSLIPTGRRRSAAMKRAAEPVVPTRLITEAAGAPPAGPAPSPIASEGVRCPQCGGAMSPRAVNHHEIWLCVRFPQCKGAVNPQ